MAQRAVPWRWNILGSGERNSEAKVDLSERKSFQAENAGCLRWYLFGAWDFNPSWGIIQNLRAEIKGPGATGKIHSVIQNQSILV